MLTKEQTEKYLNSPYHCPFCGSEEIEQLQMIFDDNITGTVTCRNCGKNWEDEYKVVGVSEL